MLELYHDYQYAADSWRVYTSIVNQLDNLAVAPYRGDTVRTPIFGLLKSLRRPYTENLRLSSTVFGGCATFNPSLEKINHNFVYSWLLVFILPT